MVFLSPTERECLIELKGFIASHLKEQDQGTTTIAMELNDELTLNQLLQAQAYMNHTVNWLTARRSDHTQNPPHEQLPINLPLLMQREESVYTNRGNYLHC